MFTDYVVEVCSTRRPQHAEVRSVATTQYTSRTFTLVPTTSTEASTAITYQSATVNQFTTQSEGKEYTYQESGGTIDLGTSGHAENGATNNYETGLYSSSAEGSSSSSMSFTTTSVTTTTTDSPFITSTESGNSTDSFSTDIRTYTATTTTTPSITTLTNELTFGYPDVTTSVEYNDPIITTTTTEAVFVNATTTVSDGHTVSTTFLDTYSQTTDLGATRTSTTMGAHINVLILSDFVETCDATYFVPERRVAWILTNPVGGNLSAVPANCRSETISFTLDHKTDSTALTFTSITLTIPTGTDTTDTDYTTQTLTWSGIGTNETSIGDETYQVTSNTTVSTTFTGGDNYIPNLTTTVTTNQSYTVPATEPLSTGTTTTNGTLSAYATEVGTELFSLKTTSSHFEMLSDSKARPTGFRERSYNTEHTGSYTITRSAFANISSTTVLLGASVSFTANASVTATTVTGFSAGMVYIDTEFTRLDPARPQGVEIPTGKITDRRPHWQISAGNVSLVEFFFKIGQQTSIKAPFPFPWMGIRINSDFDFMLASWSGLSVTATTSSNGNTGSGVVEASNENTDAYWTSNELRVAAGVTPDNRTEKFAINRNILDSTELGQTNGTTATATNNTSTVDSGARGTAFAFMAAFDITTGRGTPVVFMDANGPQGDVYF